MTELLETPACFPASEALSMVRLPRGFLAACRLLREPWLVGGWVSFEPLVQLAHPPPLETFLGPALRSVSRFPSEWSRVLVGSKQASK